MIFKWFQTSEAIDAGEHLARTFLLDLFQNKNDLGAALPKLEARTLMLRKSMGINFFQGAKLLQSFQRVLLDHKMEGETVTDITRHLLYSIFLYGDRIRKKALIGHSQAPTDQAKAFFLRGNECLAQHDFQKAASFYQKAIKPHPQYQEALANLSVAYLELGQPGEAEIPARDALLMAYREPVVHYNLGVILYKQNRLDEAERLFQATLRRDPAWISAIIFLGKLCLLKSRLKEAERYFQRAIKIDPNCVDGCVNMATIACNHGRFTEAEEYLQRALISRPTSAIAWAALVRTRKMAPADAEWLNTAQTILKEKLPVEEEATLRFAMGKYCDDVGDYDQAFRHYRRANELSKNSAQKYDQLATTNFVNDIIQIYSKDRLTNLPKLSKSKRPIFIVGMPRSGTSLIEQIIATHPSVTGAGELLFWIDVLVGHGGVRKIISSKRDLKKLADEYLRLLSEFSTKTKWVTDKFPMNFQCLGLIHSVLPHARIIHVYRNPIDCCLSNYFQQFSPSYNFSFDLADLAHFYREYWRLMAHWQTVLSPELILNVPYEAVVENQEEWSRKMYEFIGLDWDRHYLDFHLTQRPVNTSSNWQVRQKIYKDSVGRWRNYEKYVGPLLELLDDAESGTVYVSSKKTAMC